MPTKGLTILDVVAPNANPCSQMYEEMMQENDQGSGAELIKCVREPAPIR